MNQLPRAKSLPHVKLDAPKNRSSAAGSSSGPQVVSIPDHELIRQIGKGAYGEVWLARNIMGAFRAIKIVRRDGFDSTSPFEREFTGIKRFEPISRTHEGFVDILQVGLNESEGLFYYIMEVADDLHHGQEIDPKTYIPKTLGKALARSGRFSVEECVQTGMALCQALEHLHRRGLVHRDVKPSNIVFVNGAPKLADIGLVTDSEHARTFVGTEGFIPPEGPGTPGADIYGLGKALYEIASGRDRLDFPALPPDLETMSDRVPFLELNEALIRACRQNPSDRYLYARDMYEDLALLVSAKSLRKLRILERRWAALKRNAAIAAIVIAVLTLVGFPLVREWQHSEEIRERSIGVHSANGINRLESGDHLGALSEFAEVFALEEKQAHRFAVGQTRIASILATTPVLSEMKFLNERIGAIQFSHDGKLLLAVEKKKDVRLFDLQSGQEIKTGINETNLAFVAFSPDDRLILTSSEAGSASIWDFKSGHEPRRLLHPMNVLCAIYSHNGLWIATGCRDGHVRIWDSRSGALKHDLPGHSTSVRGLAFSPDDRLLASASIDRTARVWDLALPEPDSFVLPHPDWVSSVCFSPDAKRLLSAGHDGWARLWDIHTAQEIPTLMRHEGQVAQAGFSPDGSRIFTASMDGTLRLWDGATTRPLERNHILRHSSDVFSAAFNSDGRRIASGCADGAVRVWELDVQGFKPTSFTGVVNDDGASAAILSGNSLSIQSLAASTSTRPASLEVPGTIRNLALSRNASKVAVSWTAADQSLALAVWNLPHLDKKISIPLDAGSISKLVFSRDNSFLSFNNGAVTRIIDTKTGRDWPIPGSFLENKPLIAFANNSERVAIGSGNKIALFENVNSAPLVPILTLEGDIRHLVFSPQDDLLLVSQGDDNVTAKPAVLVNFRGREPKLTRLWHKDGVLESTFHPTSSRIATAGENRQVLIWDLNSSREILSPMFLPHQVMSISYSHDGQFLGAVSGNRSVQIWDADTGHPVTPPLFNGRRPTRILFTPDRNRFITIDDPLQFSLWELPRSNISPEDAVALSHLLNSDLQTRGDEGARPFAEAWSQLRNRIPHRN
jgi:WD40 repeat protein